MRILKKLLIICILAGLHLSCQHREVYFRYVNISDYEWNKTDTLYFEVDSSLIDRSALYDVSFELKHNVQYPYQNIWLSVADNISEAPDAKSVQYLVADEYGKWMGAGFGSVYQISLLYKEGVKFSNKRNTQLKVIHKMKNDPLAGIESLGLKIEKRELNEK